MAVEHESSMAPEAAVAHGPAIAQDAATVDGQTTVAVHADGQTAVHDAVVAPEQGGAHGAGAVATHASGTTAAHTAGGTRRAVAKHRSLQAERRIGRGFEITERVLVYLVAFLLIGFALLSLYNTVSEVATYVLGKAPDIPTAITKGIDGAFLAVILLELLHTVLSHGPLSRQLQEFLVIGITSAVRHSLEITARSNGGPERDVGIDLVINAGGVLVLVVALWLIRQQTTPADDKPGVLVGEAEE